MRLDLCRTHHERVGGKVTRFYQGLPGTGYGIGLGSRVKGERPARDDFITGRRVRGERGARDRVGGPSSPHEGPAVWPTGAMPQVRRAGRSYQLTPSPVCVMGRSAGRTPPRESRCSKRLSGEQGSTP